MKDIASVSVHGGHSGQFCHHATDTLEEIIQQYIAKQFPWVGITEHAPGLAQHPSTPTSRPPGMRNSHRGLDIMKKRRVRQPSWKVFRCGRRFWRPSGCRVAESSTRMIRSERMTRLPFFSGLASRCFIHSRSWEHG